MKSLIPVFLAFVLVTGACQAQQEPSRHSGELSVSYGVLGMQQILDFYSDIFLDIMGGVITTNNTDAVGPVTVAYTHAFSDVVSLGVEANVVRLVKDCDVNIANTKTPFTVTNMYYSLMPRLDLTWLRAGAFTCSTSLAAGVLHLTQTSDPSKIENHTIAEVTDTYVAFQVTPLRLRIGGTVGGFVEIGLGHRGLLAGGLSVQL